MVSDSSFSNQEPTDSEALSPGEGFAPAEDLFQGEYSPPAVLDEGVRRGEQQLALLKTITARLGRTSPEELAPAVPFLGRLIPGAERCIILLFNPGKNILHTETVVNLPPEFILALDYNEQRTRLLTTTAEQANSSLVIYLPGNKPFSSLWRIAQREDIKTFWLIPWRDRNGGLLGAILFGSARAFSPSQNDLAVATLLTEWMLAAWHEVQARQENERFRSAFDNSSSSPQGSRKYVEPDFISVLSHELLSPLTLIKGYTATLLQLGDAVTEEQKKKYIRGIDAATGKLTRLLESFRDISRLESSTPNLALQSTFLPDLLRKTVSGIQAQTTKHVIKLRLFRPLPPVNIDRQKMEQVLTNLLVNAVKYSPQGGEIELAVKPAQDSEKLREILGWAPSVSLEVGLIDTYQWISKQVAASQ